MSILDQLSRCQTLKSIAPEDLRRIADKSSCKHFGRNQIIFSENEPCNSLKLLASGSIKAYKMSPEGKEIVITIQRTNEVFGALEFLTGSTYCLGIQAIEEADIISIPRNCIFTILDRYPQVMTRLIFLGKIRFNYLLEKLYILVNENAEGRITKTLEALSKEYGNTLPFTHKELADMSATTSETMCRVLTKLKKTGAIQLCRGQVIIQKDLLFSQNT